LGIYEDMVIQKKAKAGCREFVSEKAGSRPLGMISIERLDRVSTCLNRGLAWIAGCSLMLMMLLVVANGISRMVYAPFYGTTEVVGWLCAMTTAFALGYTQVHRGYVEMDMLVEKLPRRLRNGIKSMMFLISAVFFALVSWQVAVYALNVAANGNVSETMGITFYPLIFLVALGFAGLTLALFVDFLKQVSGGVGS